MTKKEILARYSTRRSSSLVPLAHRLHKHLEQVFDGFARLDRIQVRAKGIASFVEKALRIDKGRRKYRDPFLQIQDQIGARIVVYYLIDVPRAAAVAEKYLRAIEARDVIPESDKEFDYFGKHFVFHLPDDVRNANDGEDCPQFFELQIKTLFQYAWSEAEHDLGYKPTSRLDSERRRKIAFTAAQAWGADLIFDELHRSFPPANDTTAS